MKVPEIIIIDDEPLNLSILSRVLNPHYKVKACKSGPELLKMLATDSKPDMILLDIMMPHMDGYATLSKIKENSDNVDIPVIFISGLGSCFDEEKGLHLGAVDYITKPFKPALVLERVKVHLELKQARDRLKDQNIWLESEVERRLQENLLIQDATLFVITQLTETRDLDTSKHIFRTRTYVELLVENLKKDSIYSDQLDDATVLRIVKATPLHDIGKIGIPDAILNKPGIYTPEEFEIMKSHCLIGGNAIKNAINQAIELNNSGTNHISSQALAFLEEAETIATFHHEKWDGSGYPFGLKGTEIPLAARLMALADVYDALTTSRVYKKAWPAEETLQYIKAQNGYHFDPEIVAAFEAEYESFKKVHQEVKIDLIGR